MLHWFVSYIMVGETDCSSLYNQLTIDFESLCCNPLQGPIIPMHTSFVSEEAISDTCFIFMVSHSVKLCHLKCCHWTYKLILVVDPLYRCMALRLLWQTRKPVETEHAIRQRAPKKKKEALSRWGLQPQSKTKWGSSCTSWLGSWPSPALGDSHRYRQPHWR